MGFNILKAVTRAVGLPDKAAPILGAAILPLGATQLAINAIENVAGAVTSSVAQPSMTQTHAVSPGGPGNIEIIQSPQQPASNYYPQYQVAPSGSYLGGDQWGYSTYSPAMTFPQATYSQPAYRSSVSVGQRNSPIWEDFSNLLPLVSALL